MAERLNQVKIYLGKHWRVFINEKGWKTILFAAVVSLLVSVVMKGTMYNDDVNTQIGFFTLISAGIWIGIFNSIQNICRERNIIKREHRTGLHISSYVLSHMIFQAGICVLEALILLIISGVLVGYRSTDALLINIYLEYFITYFLIIYAADVLALAVSSIVHSATTAMTIMPFILIFQLLFAGVLFSLGGAADIVADFTISKWGLYAVESSCDYNTLEKLEQKEMRYQLKKIADSKNITLTEEELDEIMDYSYSDMESYDTSCEHSFANLAGKWVIILAHAVAYGCISVAALEFIDKDRR